MKYAAKLKTLFKILELGGVNWIKTIYFNLHYLPIKIACRLPILIYRNTKLSQMKGRVLLKGTSTKMGMIRIGKNGVGTLDVKYNRTIWQNNGTVIFGGTAHIGSGTKLSINRDAILTIGHKFCVTGNSSIICSKEVSFGKECLLSWDILIMDTDFHNIYDANGEIMNAPKPVRIGNHVWIGCRNLILKGVNVSDNNVIAAGSKITKDITAPNCIVGGNDNQRILKENICWRA